MTDLYFMFVCLNMQAACDIQYVRAQAAAIMVTVQPYRCRDSSTRHDTNSQIGQL